ncbi:MAG: cold shock domain-containing protein [Anaerolineae bacterium]
MAEGIVKWFSNLKSCDFISCDGARGVRPCSAIQGSGFRLLSAGGRVEPSVKQREGASGCRRAIAGDGRRLQLAAKLTAEG